jgi:hypothetical protein
MANTQSVRGNSTKVIWVGCKLIHGITLSIFEDTPPLQSAPGVISPLMFKPPATKASVTLKGANSCRNDFTLRGLSQPQFPYGITPVPKDFWDEWLAQKGNKDFAFIKGGLVFALDRERDTVAEGKRREGERTGTEPLDQACERDPRMPSQKSVPPEQRVTADHEWLAHLNAQNGRDLS